ncbi:stress activated map kinase interacting [Ophiostoma piceae UAMH 11346]|uniref:Stress activated map kinase interacting n=1 Tax=Ophiostoma piceae (strain UAMH 11346) TaxID=1262450 RepID=S3CLG9_OPHP1|nr:stress activated map kinase interacting [Ophiostoma piceae UAMH 11346]
MGLVDYNSDSDSGSDVEAPAPSAATSSTSTSAAKKPFQKLVDRANPGKILVNLPTAAADAKAAGGDAEGDDGRPAKRAKVGGGGGRFSGFGSFLPPPKKTPAAAAASTAASASKETTDSPSPSSLASPSSTSAPKRSAVNLKTSSEAAFARRGDDSVLGDLSTPASFIQSLPPPKAPSIPRDQKAAGDVKLVGNPLMFMPLSVSRKPVKKKAAAAPARSTTASASAASAGTKRTAEEDTASASAMLPPLEKKKKVSLFSIGVDEPVHQPEGEEETEGEAQATETDYSSTYGAVPAAYGYEYGTAEAAAVEHPESSSLDAFANDMQLSAKERRELFGRTGAAKSAQISATFNMDKEYRQNEQMRQSGEADAQLQARNKVRTVMPGKHSLKQLVDAVHTQKDALEETFAKNRASQRESGGRYGWR